MSAPDTNPRPDTTRLADTADAPLWKRLAWMAAIWALSVAALGVVAYILRLWISPA